MRGSGLVLLLSVLPGLPAFASPESTQLALALKQLNGVKASLERARKGADTDPQARYYFDYLQAQRDLDDVEAGIQRYLTPSRAQPRAVVPLIASYQREHARD